MNANKLIAIAVVAASAVMAADRTVTENWTLTQDETVDGTLTVYPGATVNLNGHDLRVNGLKGAAILTDANGAQYEQLEYIESDGTQYIVTDFTPAAGDRAEVQVAFTEDNKHYSGIISTRDVSGGNGFSIWRAYDSAAGYSLRLDYGNGGERFLVAPVVNAGLNTTEIRRIVMHSGWPGNGQYAGVLKKEDGTTIADVNLAAGSYTAPGPLVLMTVGWWNNGTLATRDEFNAKMRFYWLKFDADGAKCNIVPARRVSDGTLGVFNTVTLKFLPPAAGTFTKYGEISNSLGGTITDSYSHERDLTGTDASRVSWLPGQLTRTELPSYLFNNNYVRGTSPGQRLLLWGADLPLSVDYDFGDGTPQIVDAYKVWFGTADANYVARAPKSWALYGTNDETAKNSADVALWTKLDERTSEVNWAYAEQRVYSFYNETPYRWYRIKFNEVQGKDPDGSLFLELVQLEYFRASRLVFDVPAGETAANTAVEIKGDVLVVKEGAGTLNMAKECASLGTGKTSNSADRADNSLTMLVKEGYVVKSGITPCGGICAHVAVRPGGQFDLNGDEYGYYDYEIEGRGPEGAAVPGALVNNAVVADAWNLKRFLRNVWLKGDATIGGSQDIGMSYGSDLTYVHLDGHTLTFEMSPDKFVFSTRIGYAGPGEIAVKSGRLRLTCNDTQVSGDVSVRILDGGVFDTQDKSITPALKEFTFAQGGTYYHFWNSPYSIPVKDKYAPNPDNAIYNNDVANTKDMSPMVQLGTADALTPVLDLSLFTQTFDGSAMTFQSGATVTVDTGTRTIAAGGKLVSWTSVPGAQFVLKDGEERRLEAFAGADGLYVKSTVTPAYAIWDFENSVWKYYASDDSEMPDWASGIIPTMEVRFSSVAEYAVITNAIEVSHIAPGAYRLTALSLAEGQGDIDLSGLDFIVEPGFSFDVKGNSLKLPNSLVGGSGAFTVTSSVAGGELVVDVPENETVVNSSVTLSGSLKLTKTGKGTFTPGKTAQTYTGGTEVVDGLLVCSSPGYDRAFGAANSEIKISADAAAGTFGTFDVAGNYDYDGYHFIMNGGLFKNSSVAKDTYIRAQLARMTLTADSSFYTAGDYGFIAPGYVDTTLELGGHTLTVSSDSDFYLCKTTVRNGTLDAASGSWILFGKDGTSANNWHVWFYDVLFKCAKPIKGNCTAHFGSGSVYQTDYTDGWNYGAQTMSIESGGTFRPGSHDFYRSTELYDGAILDLTRRTSALPTTSAFNPNAFAYNQGGVLSFKEGAKVAVKVDENSEFIKAAARQKGADGKPSGYIVNWTQPPANTVTFELSGEYAKSYRLHKMDGGLAIRFKPGLIIFVK